MPGFFYAPSPSTARARERNSLDSNKTRQLAAGYKH